MAFKIIPLKVGVFPSFEKSLFALGVEPGTKIQAPCISWLIEGERGEKILVDTGPHATDATGAVYHNHINCSEEDRIDHVLQQAGTDPAEIQTVLFTHLHWDHCHNAIHLPNATFYVQKNELLYAIDPIEWHFGSFESKLTGIQPPWFNIFHRLMTVDGDIEILPGLHFLLLPGHTPGSAGVAVETRQGMYMIAGDTIPLMLNWEGNERKRHIPSALNTNLIDYYHSFQKIERITNRALPAHDFRSFDQSVWG